MNDTADGYRTDIDYTYSYHSELNPLRLRLAFLNAGLPMPAVATACEPVSYTHLTLPTNREV